MKAQRVLTIMLLASASATFAEEAAHFGYSGDRGPANWSTLSPDWGACERGRSQSPIDITGAQDSEQPPLEISYTTLAQSFVNNGHAVQANYAKGSSLVDDGHANAPYAAQVNLAAGGSVAHLGATYELKQFHFHSPSEHQREGRNLAAEIHFVHAAADGKLAVIGVFVEEGDANPVIGKLWERIPESAGQSNSIDTPINAVDLLPTDRSYYFYQGSLTTPPCSEGVLWFVMQHPVTISAAQVGELRKAIGFANNRPVQPLNGRVISK